MHVNYVVHQHVNTAIYKHVVYTNGKVFLSGVAHYIQCIYKAGNLSPQNKIEFDCRWETRLSARTNAADMEL